MCRSRPGITVGKTYHSHTSKGTGANYYNMEWRSCCISDGCYVVFDVDSGFFPTVYNEMWCLPVKRVNGWNTLVFKKISEYFSDFFEQWMWESVTDGSTLKPVCPCMLFCRMSFLFGLRVDLWLVLSSARLLIHYREVTNGKVCALILHNDSD